ncbi:hypothetical protein [Pyxidicoccus xibeiensis]|uniref:hypothetical protein n=1 Tax=Pyxidicoccus xibeiensis TaxID=2906759 RepID=UPI0020A7C189|nr:hypothetical protein [Pyxidicoccus xibeiensis]MCP3140887.1 hypothetical protein [Pyxidicoccus xibeiensis]
MRAGMVGLLGLLWLGCSVQVAGAPCNDDLQCPGQLHCGLERTCKEGARSQELLAESCRMAVEEMAMRADTCFGGTAEGYLHAVDPTQVCPSVEASVRAGRLEFQPSMFGTCLRSLRELPCGQVSMGLDGFLLNECAAFVPRVEEGGECGNSAECNEGWCRTANTCPGTCARLIPAGRACTATDRCMPGSICVSGTCRQYPGAGEACTSDLKCNPDSNIVCGPEGRCVQRRTSGTCKANDDCATGYLCVRTQPAAKDKSPLECRPTKRLDEPCVPGARECELLHYCDSATSRCRPWPTQGSACGDVNGTDELVLCSGTLCFLGGGLQLICLAPAAPGEGCVFPQDCGPTAACRQNVCTPTWCR